MVAYQGSDTREVTIGSKVITREVTPGIFVIVSRRPWADSALCSTREVTPGKFARWPGCPRGTVLGKGHQGFFVLCHADHDGSRIVFHQGSDTRETCRVARVSQGDITREVTPRGTVPGKLSNRVRHPMKSVERARRL